MKALQAVMTDLRAEVDTLNLHLHSAHLADTPYAEQRTQVLLSFYQRIKKILEQPSPLDDMDNPGVPP